MSCSFYDFHQQNMILLPEECLGRYGKQGYDLDGYDRDGFKRYSDGVDSNKNGYGRDNSNMEIKKF